MRYVNKAIIIGNLTRDPDVKESNGAVLSVFNVATNRTWKDAEGEQKTLAEYHNVIAWGHLADYCNINLKIGKLVYIEGYLKTRSWEEDGKRRYRTEIVAENVSILSKKEDVPDDDPAAELV